MFDKRIAKEQSKFTVPIMHTGRTSYTHKQAMQKPHPRDRRMELEVLIGKVEERKWRVVKTYTKEKIGVVATGTIYQRPEGSNLREALRIGEMDDTGWIPEKTWREQSEEHIEDSEREAVIDAVRELSLNMYEDKTKIFGIGADTVFTQIMLGFIVGGDIPAPHPVEDPYGGLRDMIKGDFYANTNIEPEHLSL